MPSEILNYPRNTWEALRKRGDLPGSVIVGGRSYVDRTTSSGEPLPHVCLKIPTGGGKTLLGAVAVDRILARRQTLTGLVLWIVPTKAIYDQTRRSLWLRDHPYRRILDRASGDRVKVLEKDDALSAADINSYLCVMPIMLPAANKLRDRTFLKMYRGSERYAGFFPEQGNAKAETDFAKAHPGLELNESGEGALRSLLNVFRIARPIVIVDEAHKAYGNQKVKAEEYAKAISGFDPSIVVELSATPRHDMSNVLVDVNGSALHAEEMIKLPIVVQKRDDAPTWEQTLQDAHDRLEQLARAAAEHEKKTGIYIRPIAVVRCENTGKKQLGADGIHVEDVRLALLKMGVPEDRIRIKTAEVDQLAGENLMSDRSSVSWILTKDALKEGWDCPFAYVLVLLDNTQAPVALTQMVGRILRAPYARRSNVELLDQCYVFCHYAEVSSIIERIRLGLEREGMEDLVDRVITDAPDQVHGPRQQRMRKRFQEGGREIYLPKVLHRNLDGSLRDLEFHRDIQADVDWEHVKIKDPKPLIPHSPNVTTIKVGLSGAQGNISHDQAEGFDEIDMIYFCNQLAEKIPNAWTCASIVKSAVSKLMNDGGLTAGEINSRRAGYVADWKPILRKRIDRLSYKIFKKKLNDDVISFNLEAKQANYRMADTVDVPGTGSVAKDHQLHFDRSLYKPHYRTDFNGAELKFAYCMDGRKAIKWWHRIAVNQRSGFHLRGWRDTKVFPDFVAVASEKAGKSSYARQQLLIYETKGQQFKGNDDTSYKKRLLKTLQLYFDGALATKGTMSIRDGDPKGVFRIVFEGDECAAFEGTLADVP